MKKFIFPLAIAALCTLLLLSGCNTKIDYFKFVSEKRSEIYLYKDDVVDLTVHCVTREQPYNADGICGDMCDLVEIFLKLTPCPDSVEISIEGFEGDMSYEAVDSRFFASFSHGAYGAEGIDVTLNIDGVQKSYRALSVLDSGVLSCEQILKCVQEHDKGLFKSLTTKRDFKGEIYIRLLYDEGCYYYVGVCDRDKNITAYLLDGGIGKVIATKQISG